MTEIRPNHTEPAFTVSLLTGTKEMKSPEMSPLFAWFQKETATLPEMKVTKTPLTNGKDWKKTSAPNGEVDKISSPFVSIEGMDVASNPLSWHQGAMVQRSEILPTHSGEKTEVSGIVILLTNPHGETFVTVAQEPLAQPLYRTPDKKLVSRWIPQGTEIHPVIRSTIQTSIEKFNRILTNESNGMRYDPTLTKLLHTIASDRQESISNILQSVPLSKAPTDANRIVSNVVYGNIDVSDETAKKITDTIPGGRWCSQKELDTLVLSGLTNGHINIARSVTEAQRRLQSL